MAAKNISAPNTRGKNGKKKRRPREPEPLEEGSAVHWAVMRVMQRAVPVADVDVPEAADAVVAEAADAAGFAAVPEAVDSAADVAVGHQLQRLPRCRPPLAQPRSWWIGGYGRCRR